MSKVFQSRNKFVNIILVIIIICFILLSILVAYQLYIRFDISKNINKNVTIEYGKNITLDDILKKGNDFKSVKVSPELKDIKKIGNHKVTY